MFEGMESVTERWVEAWSKPMYQVADESICEKVLDVLASPEGNRHLIGAHASFLLPTALIIALRGEAMHRVARYAAAAAACLPKVEQALREDAEGQDYKGFGIRIDLLLLEGLVAPQLPAPARLTGVVSDFLDHLPAGAKAGTMHSVETQALIKSAHLAVLAGDAELLGRILALVSAATRKKSQHWSLYHAIHSAVTHKTKPVAWTAAIRLPEVQSQFLRMLNIHRRPYPQGELGKEGLVAATPVVANFLYGWMWTVLMDPASAQTMTWERMRSLMTD